MHASFSSTVAGWQTFYLLAGTASATLVGLIFVAVSLHLDLVGESGISPIFTLARRTLSSFILVVIIALVFLVPEQGPQGLGWPLLALGMVDMLQTTLDIGDVIGELTHTAGWQSFANRIVPPVVLPLLSGIGLVLVAATVLAGTTSALSWMVPLVVLVLSTAAFNAWELMLGLARHKVRHSGGHPLAGPAPADANLGGE
ncbi:MAG: hypothetical protein JOZ41_21310 [Chloroflexi bacterium]|nr:hypothetical protein [Chloroflexota bacterium]